MPSRDRKESFSHVPDLYTEKRRMALPFNDGCPDVSSIAQLPMEVEL